MGAHGALREGLGPASVGALPDRGEPGGAFTHVRVDLEAWAHGVRSAAGNSRPQSRANLFFRRKSLSSQCPSAQGVRPPPHLRGRPPLPGAQPRVPGTFPATPRCESDSAPGGTASPAPEGVACWDSVPTPKNFLAQLCARCARCCVRPGCAGSCLSLAAESPVLGGPLARGTLSEVFVES